MIYTDRFLAALGAWQNGWRELPHRRKPISIELLAAIADIGSHNLPKSTGLIAYRKRFLVQNNPENGGDYWRLIIDGQINEGIASWSLQENFSRLFKELIRPQCTTAIFEHAPRPEEVVVDIPALWRDPAFRSAVDNYMSRSGSFADALGKIGDNQFEVILSAPLIREEAIDFVGLVGEENYFFEAFGAHTEEEQDAVWKGFADLGKYPGQPVWVGRAGSQRAMDRIKKRYQAKYEIWLYHRFFQSYLRKYTSMTPAGGFGNYLRENGLHKLLSWM